MDDMNWKKITTGVFGVLLLGLCITWIIQRNDFFLYKWFAPKYEEARREAFEQSEAYVKGTTQELQRMQFEYLKASADQKDALASVILHQAAGFDESKLPSDLRDFINQLKRERGAIK